MTKKFKEWKNKKRSKHVHWGNQIRNKQKAIIFKDTIVLYEELGNGEGGTSVFFKRFPIEDFYYVNKDFCPFVFQGKVEKIRKRGC